jgi:cytochrome c peroxidase
MKKALLGLFVAASTLFVVACSSDDKISYFYYEPDDYALISKYLNLPETQPDNYSVTLADHLTRSGLAPALIQNDEAILGRVLFYDKNLSSDRTVSCGSCHDQQKGFADDKPVSLGVQERQGERNSFALSSVANFAAYYGTDLFGPSGIRFSWDNRIETTAQQTFAAMTNHKEMDMTVDEIVDAVKEQPYYAPLFRKAFGGSGEINKDRVAAAIGTFVNAMGSFQSPFDAGANAVAGNSNFGQPNYEANFSNLSAAQNRGKALYMVSCANCHTTNFGRPTIQAANNGLDAETGADRGVGGVTQNTYENGLFKVPTLRNVALSAPYMHDGRFNTLEEVVEHYSTGIKNHPNLDAKLKNFSQPKKFNFTSDEKADLVAFLGSLTDEKFKNDARFSDPFKR